MEELLESADRVFVGIPAYWRQRTGRGTSAARSAEWFARSFASAVEDLRSRGYFDERMPPACPDGKRVLEVTPSQFLDRITGFEGLWRDLIRTPEYLEQNLLFEVVEVLHDAASRPVSGWYHDWNNCGWHYEVFRATAGKAIYRWTVNELLDSTAIPLRLADEGDDQGRLVAVTNDARDELIHEALTRNEAPVGRTSHAIALFRSRGATRDDKRSAVKDLADVLEQRRPL